MIIWIDILSKQSYIKVFWTLLIYLNRLSMRFPFRLLVQQGACRGAEGKEILGENEQNKLIIATREGGFCVIRENYTIEF